MDHLELSGRFDRPNVLIDPKKKNADLSLLITISPGESLRQIESDVRAGTNVCLLIDVSQSMEEEGKLSAAIAAGRELVELTGHQDTLLSIVAFDDEPYILASGLSAKDKATLLESLEGLKSVGGGMTNITSGLDAAINEVVQQPDESRARVIILLSDGEDNTCKPDVIHSALRAAENDIQLFAVGIGDSYEADFLKALVAPSNGTLFGHEDVQKVKEAFIDLAITLASVVATQVVLTLDFHPKALVGKTYKASPDQLFLGNARPGPDRRLSRRVGNVERNKAYAFLYTLSTPTDQESPLPLVHATLSYDVPALNIRQAQVETTFGVHLSKDRALTERQDGAVLECYRRVQITELVERFVDAHHAGRAQDTSRYLDLLIKKYNDVNDQKMVNHYQKIRSSLVAGGLISRPMINASVVASTVVRGGGELPQLVSDDF